ADRGARALPPAQAQARAPGEEAHRAPHLPQPPRDTESPLAAGVASAFAACCVEVKRGMARVGLQQLVVLVRKLADALREGGVLRPKGRRSKMLQISFDLPDL